jgi:hypothetical protein
VTAKSRRAAGLHQFVCNQSFPPMPFIKMDSLHNFQYFHFSAGGNQAMANGTMAFHDARVGCIKPHDKWVQRQRWHSGLDFPGSV